MARRIWLPLIGFIVWAVAFIVLYGAQALGCAFGWGAIGVGPIDLHRLVLVGLYLVTIAILAQAALWLARQDKTLAGEGAPSDLLGRAGLYGGLAALGAGIFTYAPVLFVSTCV